MVAEAEDAGKAEAAIEAEIAADANAETLISPATTRGGTAAKAFQRVKAEEWINKKAAKDNNKVTLNAFYLLWSIVDIDFRSSPKQKGQIQVQHQQRQLKNLRQLHKHPSRPCTSNRSRMDSLLSQRHLRQPCHSRLLWTMVLHLAIILM